MDDTNWIANSQQNLKEILMIADNFNNLTGAVLNKSKSKLILTKSFASQTIDINFGSS
ncbi:1322_t:CDS:1, partial [Funneliformis geosporum]